MATGLLLDRLRDSGLLENAQLEELTALPEAKDPDPRALGRILLQRRLLTRSQINLAAQGRGNDLQIGPYLLMEKIGEGGMGEVFKAHHRHMDRVVALKIIRKEKLAGPDAVSRFMKEIRSAAQLTHPNIVMAYDAGQAGAVHYFAMEFVAGIDLSRLVKEKGPLPTAQACEYIRQAAIGLQHAHEKGMVHRDIKPHNLLVLRDGSGGVVVKVLDMGLARLQGQNDEKGLTQTGQVVGTPDYLSPEQAMNSRAVDIRSDIYSLGCTLYYLLSGQAPFTGESLTQVLLQHQMEEPPPLTKVRPDVSAAVQKVVGKMMAKKPAERYQTPSDVAHALESLAQKGGGEEAVVVAPSAKRGSEAEWDTLSEAVDPNSEKVSRSTSRRKTEATEVEIEAPVKKGKKAKKGKKRGNKLLLWIGLGAGGVGVVVLVVVLISLLTRNKATDGTGSVAMGSPTQNAGRQTTDRPISDKPPGDKPATDKPALDKPPGDKPPGDKPATDKPAMPDKIVSATMFQVNGDPEKYTGQTVLFEKAVLLAGTIKRGEKYELQAGNEKFAKPNGIRFSLSKKLANKLAAEGRLPERQPVHLTCKIEFKENEWHATVQKIVIIGNPNVENNTFTED